MQAGEATAREITEAPRGAGSRSVLGSRLGAWDAVILFVLTAVAGALTFYDLGDKPLAADEATSYFMAWVPWDGFWHSVTTSEANASLFYGLLRIPAAFGSDPFLLRAIAALCGALSVPVVYLALARLFDRATAVVGAAALTANVLFISHAQEVRGYSMAAFFAALATLFFLRSVERPNVANLSIYALASVAGCYSHFFCALVVAAHFLSLFLLPKGVVAWKRFVATYVAVGGLCAPLAYFIMANDRGQVDWIPATTGKIVLKVLYEIAGDGGPALGIVVGVCVLIAVGRALVTAVVKRRSFDTFAVGLVVLWALVPLLFAAAVSVVKPLFVARYLLPALPGVAAAIAVGIGVLRVAPLIVAAGAVVVTLSAVQIPPWYQAEALDWGARADTVVENARPGDAVLFYSPPVIRPFGYYSGYYAERPDGRVAPDPIYPDLGWLGYSQTRFKPDYEDILARAAEHERVWFVTGYARDRPRRREKTKLIEMLTASCERVPGFGGAVDLYEDCRSR